MKQKKIIFIHGMFQNPVSWQPWINYFNDKGFDCISPAWPFHEGEPASLRANPPESLGDLTLEDVIDSIEQVVISNGGNSDDISDKPILIGHSVGGLITQVLVNRNLASLGISICPVAPNMMMTLDWPFFKNVAAIANPFKGDKPFEHDANSFHEGFCNTLSEQEAQSAFDETATPDSRNVLRGCLGASGHIDLDQAHAPLLFISAVEDQIIPFELVKKNAEAYTDQKSIVDYLEISGTSHYICGEPGKEKIMNQVESWIADMTTRDVDIPDIVL